MRGGNQFWIRGDGCGWQGEGLVGVGGKVEDGVNAVYCDAVLEVDVRVDHSRVVDVEIGGGVVGHQYVNARQSCELCARAQLREFRVVHPTVHAMLQDQNVVGDVREIVRG